MEEKERIEIIGKSLLLIILTIVISIFAWFFYGVSKVNAQAQIRVKNNGSWSSWTDNDPEAATTATNVPSGSTWASWAQVKDTVAMLNDRTYNLEATIIVVYDKSSSTDLTSANDLHIYNGSTLVAMDSKCSTTVSTQSIVLKKRYEYNIKCNAISGNGYYPYISVMSKASPSQTRDALILVSKWEYHLNSNDSNTNAVLEGINQQTEIITNNNNQNTENIINNQNNIWQEQIEFFENQYNQYNESQQVCERISLENSNIYESILNSNGNIQSTSGFNITDYINISTNDKLSLILESQHHIYACFYDIDKNLISCFDTFGIAIGTLINIPSNASYFRTTIRTANDKPQFELCKNGNQALMDGPSWQNEDPDSNSADELEDLESDLGDYLVDDSDVSELDYSVDSDTNIVIWNIFNRVITGNQIVYTGMLTILFLGIIKLILAR